MVALATSLRSQSDDPISKLHAKGRLSAEQVLAARLLRQALRRAAPSRRGFERFSAPPAALALWVRQLHLRIGLEAGLDKDLAWPVLQKVVIEGHHVRPVADEFNVGPPRVERVLALVLDVIVGDPPPA